MKTSDLDKRLTSYSDKNLAQGAAEFSMLLRQFKTTGDALLGQTYTQFLSERAYKMAAKDLITNYAGQAGCLLRLFNNDPRSLPDYERALEQLTQAKQMLAEAHTWLAIYQNLAQNCHEKISALPIRQLERQCAHNQAVVMFNYAMTLVDEDCYRDAAPVIHQSIAQYKVTLALSQEHEPNDKELADFFKSEIRIVEERIIENHLEGMTPTKPATANERKGNRPSVFRMGKPDWLRKAQPPTGLPVKKQLGLFDKTQAARPTHHLLAPKKQIMKSTRPENCYLPIKKRPLSPC